MRVILLLWLASTGCRFFTVDNGQNATGRRASLKSNEVPSGVPLGPDGAPMITQGSPKLVDEAILGGPRVAELPPGTPGLVVFAVLDTVRAASVGACGADRKTGQVLETLQQRGAVLTCDAYTPATWTIPSHAAYFTGLPAFDVPLHRKGMRLPDEAQTLAELFTERGYQTLMLSANPVLKEETGLQAGFQRVRISPGLVGPLRSDGFAIALRQELLALDPDRPAFLFLNIFDAHDPYPAIPAGTEGFPERPAFAHRTGVRDVNNPFYAYLMGTLPAAEAADYAAQARDGYEYGVSQADRVLARSLKILERSGRTEHGTRLVVTSDHGEAVGEHGRLGHDGPPFEELTRVPLLFWDSLAAAQPTLEGPLSAVSVHDLVAHGRLPDPPLPVASVAFRYGDSDVRYHDGAATWTADGRKLRWINGEGVVVDLRRDPEELRPRPPATPEEVAGLAELAAQHAAAKARSMEGAVDAGAVEELQKLGYVDE